LDWDEIWYNFTYVYALTESDFQFVVTLSRWRLWRHFMQESAAIWCVHMQRPTVDAAAYAAC